MTSCCNHFTSKCEQGHGCAAHTEPCPVLDEIESEATLQPWDAIDRLITAARWLIGFAAGAALAFWVYTSI